MNRSIEKSISKNEFMKKIVRLKTTLYSLIIILFLLLAYFLIPFPVPIKRTLFSVVVILGFIFFMLGIILTFMAKKEKGKLKLFLMLTGISAIAPFIFSILHNLFYGLAITFENFELIFEILSASFFIIAIIVAPIMFVVGIVGSLVFLRTSQSG
jgi:hypothetical protein